MGHGRAIREVLVNGDAEREAIILAACWKSTLFDYQTDEDKGWYLSEIFCASNRPNHYIDLLLTSEHRIRGSRNRSQWYDLLTSLAARGFPQVKEYLAENWAKEIDAGRCSLAAAYIETGPPDSYRQVLDYARVAWRRRRKPIDDAFSLYMAAEDSIGEKQAKRIKAEFATADPWFAKIADLTESTTPYRPPEIAILDRIRAGRLVFGRNSTAEDRSAVVEMLTTDLEFKVARSALHFFSKAPFPGDLDILLRWLNHEDEKIQWWALNVLGKLKHPRIRELAFTWCNVDSCRDSAIGILSSNFELGDEIWIEQQLQRAIDQDSLHHSIMDVFDVIRANSNGKWLPVLRHIYGRVACQICRCTAATLLQDRRHLTDEDVEDLCLDASESTRVWAGKIRGRRNRSKASLLRSPKSLLPASEPT